jgi:hypothetical protein
MSPSLPIVALLAGALLFPLPAAAQYEPSEYDERVIAPAVVRQGDFALQLAQALALDIAPDDEDQAVYALVALGIEPAMGWQADYAMTPQIVTELRADVADAAATGRLGMDADAALAAFDGLLAELALPLPAESVPAYAGGAPPVGYAPYCDAGALQSYYGGVGLPIYSYCTPPVAYLHYYSWVPCGFRAHGHRFAGFFIQKQIIVIPRHHAHDRPRFDGRHDRGKRKLDVVVERSVIRAAPLPERLAPVVREVRRDIAADGRRRHVSKNFSGRNESARPQPPARVVTSPDTVVRPIAPSRRVAAHGVTKPRVHKEPAVHGAARAHGEAPPSARPAFTRPPASRPAFTAPPAARPAFTPPPSSRPASAAVRAVVSAGRHKPVYDKTQ